MNCVIHVRLYYIYVQRMHVIERRYRLHIGGLLSITVDHK